MNYRYIISRIIVGLCIGVGMFYFRSAHAASATHEALWYLQQAGENQAYARNSTFIGNTDPLGNRPISNQLFATGVNATANGPIINGNRTLIPSQTGRGITLTEAVTIGAGAARVIARAYPAILIASALYDAYQSQGFTVNQQTGQIQYAQSTQVYTGTCGSRSNYTYSQCIPFISSNPDFTIMSPCTPATPNPNFTFIYCQTQYGNQNLGTFQVSSVQTVAGTPAPATDLQLDDAWRAGNGPLQAQQKDFVQRAVAADVSADLSNESTAITSPLVSETPHVTSTTTKTNPDGSTSTQTREDFQTVTLTPTGDKFGSQTITTNVTNNYKITNNAGQVIETNVTTAPAKPATEENKQSPKGAFTGKGGTSKTFGESTTDFYTRAKTAPLLSGISNIANDIPSTGQCPTASFTVLGRTFIINSHCPLLDQFSATIKAVCWLGWLLLAVRIFLSA